MLCEHICEVTWAALWTYSLVQHQGLCHPKGVMLSQSSVSGSVFHRYNPIIWCIIV